MAIKYYSKKGCLPCEFLKPRVLRKIDCVEVIEFETDAEVISAGEKFGIRTVPFMVINDKQAIYGFELTCLISYIKSI